MNKIKRIDEFENILEYFYYLKNSLDDLNQKKNRSVSADTKKFYQEQIDAVIKMRSSIRDVVLAKKEQIIHEKMATIKQDQIKNFIKTKKKEKEQLSAKKLNLELEIALYKSIHDLDADFFAPIAKYAHEYDCSDFFITDDSFCKSYLIKNSHGELEEYPATIILSQYLDSNIDLVDKFTKRHELKEEFLSEYVSNLKNTYPDYSDKKLKKLAHDNLVSHSPEFLEKLESKYPISDQEFKELSKAYSDFKADYKYLEKKDIIKMEDELKNLKSEFDIISKIPDGKDLEKYLLEKFNNSQKQLKLVKSASETLKNDSNIEKYMKKNNLLNNTELSSETKTEYIEKLSAQNDLLNKIIDVELENKKFNDALQEYENKLDKLKHSKSELANIYTTENVINNVAEIVEDYTENFVNPLEQVKKEFEEYKKSNEEALIPYKKPTFLGKIIGFFNGKNKLQNEFNEKCIMYKSKINVLTQKSRMNRPDYNFDDKHILAKSIGQDMKDYFLKNPDANDHEACTKVLKKYKESLNKNITSFKSNYSELITNLDTCSSYDEISNCLLEEINNVQKQIDSNKARINILAENKRLVCDEYNKNSTRPIQPISTLTYLEKVSTEHRIQLDKLSNYKGENIDTLQYKIQVEKLLESDGSFISEQEKQELNSTAVKKAKQILNKAIDNYKQISKEDTLETASKVNSFAKHIADDELVI